MSTTLTASLQDRFEHQREQEWKRKGVSQNDILFSRLCGMDAVDVSVFRRVSAERALIIITRCPKLTARPWHGTLMPKPASIKEEKTGTSGVVVTDRGLFVSDYDLMGVWRHGRKGYERICMSAPNGAPRGPWTAEAHALVRYLNQQLVSRIQHGAQDDFDSPLNPGVKPTDHFAAFANGHGEYLPSVAACEAYYARYDLDWPYDGAGRYSRK